MKLIELSSKEVNKVEDFFSEQLQQNVWRLGFYKDADTRLEDAGEAAIQRLLRLLAGVKKSHNVLCLGALGINFGNSLVERFGCNVTVLIDEELTEEKSYKKILEGEYPEKMTIDRGSLSILPYGGDSFDIVVSVESLAHFEDKERALRQIAFVLKPKGRMLFTSLFVTRAAIFAGLDLSETTLVAKEQYNRLASNSELDQVLNMDMTDHLAQQYEALLKVIEQNEQTANKLMGKQLTSKFNDWLQTRITHLRSAELGWGVYLFQKSNVVFTG